MDNQNSITMLQTVKNPPSEEGGFVLTP